MGALAELAAGSFRGGRTNAAEEVRQLQDQQVERDDLLRRAILELAAATGVETSDGSGGGARRAIESSFCVRTGNQLFYAPWAGSAAEALAGGVDEEVMLLPPFGTSTRIVSVSFLGEASAGSTVVSIRQTSESVEQSVTVASVTAGNVATATFNYDWTDGDPKVIGFDPTNNPQRWRAVVVFEEAS